MFVRFAMLFNQKLSDFVSKISESLIELGKSSFHGSSSLPVRLVVAAGSLSHVRLRKEVIK